MGGGGGQKTVGNSLMLGILSTLTLILVSTLAFVKLLVVYNSVFDWVELLFLHICLVC